eukprot:GGOE01061793.1.p1 GENE.GGOE01061793.1~~GGOE01061793.1.p1  ORF type:complete len:382 (+),score=51.33 GGOE01061793.1:84-1229(+)
MIPLKPTGQLRMQPIQSVPMEPALFQPSKQATNMAKEVANDVLSLEPTKETSAIDIGFVSPSSFEKSEGCTVDLKDVSAVVEVQTNATGSFDDPIGARQVEAISQQQVPLVLQVYRKIPELNLLYWIMKITATTLGETFADMIAQTMHVGYWQTTLILLSFFVVTLIFQMCVTRYWPILYWAVILSTSTAGTTISDWMDRTLHLGYIAGSGILLGILVGIFVAWYFCQLPFSVSGTMSRPAECFYWAAILISNTLGTALGDCVSDEAGFGFAYSALLFGGLIALIAIVSFVAPRLRVFGFWAAFVLTRPFGAAFGDYLDKDEDDGGLQLGTYIASAILGGILLAFLLAAIYVEHFHTKLPRLEGPGWQRWTRNRCVWLWGL